MKRYLIALPKYCLNRDAVIKKLNGMIGVIAAPNGVEDITVVAVDTVSIYDLEMTISKEAEIGFGRQAHRVA